MRGLQGICAALALLASLAGPMAQASTAHLDRDFGSNGVRFLSSSLGEMTGVALVGDGRVVVGGQEELVALLPSGRLDPGFGRGGRVRLVQPPRGEAEIFAFAIDPAGRPVTVGHFGTASADGSWVKWEPFVQRFTSAGRLDSGFGEDDGYAQRDLGLPPAPQDGGTPEAYVDDVAFDSSNRIVLTGGSTTGAAAVNGDQERGSFLARLQASGRVDRSFAQNGLYFLPGAVAYGSWAIGPGGRVVVGGGKSMLRLRQSGRPDGRFGEGGYAPYPPGTSHGPLLVDRRERTIVSGYLEGLEHELANGILIRRLRPNGALDRGFGKGGAVRLRIPRFYVADMALDERGRVLIAVSLKVRGPVGEPHELALVRLRVDGGLDETFGRGGMIRIPFPGKRRPSVYLEGIDVRSGQAAIGATYCGFRSACRPVVALVDL